MEVGFLFGAGQNYHMICQMVENLRWIFLEEMPP